MQDPRGAGVPPDPVDPTLIPPDVLELIAMRLPLRDRLAMTATCTRWRASLLRSETAWGDLSMRLVAAKVASLALWLGLRPEIQPTSLALTGSGMPDDLLADHLAAILGRRCDTVTSISLTRVNLPAAAPFLIQFPNLTALEFSGGDLTLGAEFSKITSLKSANLQGRTMAFAPVPPSLRSLRLEDFTLPAPLAGLLSGATGLTSLTLRGVFFATGVPWQAVSAVWALESLQDLTLSIQGTTGWPPGVTRLTALTRLDLSGTDIGNDDSAAVAPLTALQDLGLAGCRLQTLPAGLPTGLRRLAVHHNPHLHLWHMNRQSVSFDAASVAHDFGDALFGDGVETVAVHRHPGATVRESVVTRLLRQLKAAPKLRRVEFWDRVLERSLTQEGAAALVALVASGVQVEVRCDEDSLN